MEYSSNKCTMLQTDINECVVGSDNCADEPAATCTNLPGTFTCRCNPGWSGDGVICTGKLK